MAMNFTNQSVRPNLLLVMTDQSLQSATGQQLLEAQQHADGQVRVILINDGYNRDQTIEEIASSQIDGVVPTMDSGGSDITGHLDRMLRQAPVGVDTYLSGGSQVSRWTLADATDKERVLAEVRKVARTEENIMPVIIEAVKSYATVGEISDALRDVFGEYREPSIL